MVNIENALGKKIQISNSEIYSNLKNKIDYYLGTDYENLLLSISNLAFTLGKYVGADEEKIKLYTAILGLGKVDGGEVTLNYINDKIENESDIIKELDVMFYNLKTIFPDFKEKFTEECLKEISELFSDNCTQLETKVIRIVYYLKLISQHYKNNNKLDDKQATIFIFNQIASIINDFKVTKKLGLSEDLKNVVNDIYQQKFNLAVEDQENLNLLINDYNNGIVTKGKFIENLNDYRIKKEKKTKIR